MAHFFTFRLMRAGHIVRVGKGSAPQRQRARAKAYLSKRYPRTRYNTFELSWHGSEAAAVKHAERLLDGYRRQTGALPPRNARRGGGARALPRCKGRMGDRRRCANGALAGNYGYCGRHRP
jgi:hypothetical protein